MTVENIRNTRYSRNPRISRVLTEFGWVQELNEGVKRIYTDMEQFFLEPPIYSEPEQSVKLVLKNNIVMRTMRQKDRAVESIGAEVWAQLDTLEKAIVAYLLNVGPAKRAALKKHTGKSNATIQNRLNHLIEAGLVEAIGSITDPTRKYQIKTL